MTWRSPSDRESERAVVVACVARLDALAAGLAADGHHDLAHGVELARAALASEGGVTHDDVHALLDDQARDLDDEAGA